MSDRDAPVFMAGVAVGALLTVLGFKLFSKCPQTARTHQVGAKPKCICKKGTKEEEKERQRAEAASKGRSSSRQAGAADSAATTPDCGFFTCGLGSIFSRRGGGFGSVCPSVGGWLPIAGAVLLLAMMAYMFKNAGKLFKNAGNLFGTGNFSSLFPAKRSSDGAKCG